MNHFIKSTVIASAAFLVLALIAMAINSLGLHHGEQPSQIVVTLIIFIYTLPFVISGYIGGRKAAKYGLFIGFLSCTLPLVILGVLFTSLGSSIDMTMVMNGILISTLSGGVGELYAVRAKIA
jgi:MFS family permease